MQIKIIVWTDTESGERSLWISDGDRRMVNLSIEEADAMAADLASRAKGKKTGGAPIRVVFGEREFDCDPADARRLAEGLAGNAEEARKPKRTYVPTLVRSAMVEEPA